MEKILIADDVAVNRKFLETILAENYVCILAEDGKQAFELALENAAELSLILLDIMMPEYNGYEVLRLLKGNGLTKNIPVILITSLDSEYYESRGLSEGAIDYITKPFNQQVVKCRVRNHVELKKHQNMLFELVEQRTAQVLEMRESLLDALTSIIEYRSLESGKHVKRIRLFCEAQLNYILERRLFPHELDEKIGEHIVRASTLHDIGKVGVPDSILFKVTKLTPEEFEVMKLHTIWGSEFVDSIGGANHEEYLFYAQQICRYHHERWDGMGYPDGICGEDIPLAARIVSVADVYDSLVSRRTYKPPYTHEIAANIIRSGKGTQFDPTLVEVFEAISDQFRQIAVTNND